MHTLSSFRLPALFLAVALVLAGCDGFDSGTSPTEATVGDDSGAMVSFTTEGFSAVESSGTITIGVTITNPPNDTVTAEVLYADAASATDPSDFGLTESDRVGAGRLAGTVVFPDTATTGNTQTIELNIQDDETGEEREEGIFALQNVRNATIGDTNRLSVTIGAIRVFFADFSDGLQPFTAVSLQSNFGWGTAGAGGAPNAPVAEASGFNNGNGEPSDDWLISPAFNFNVLEDETLSFLNAKGFTDQNLRGLQVKVSTDYNGDGDSTSVANATWTDVSDQVTFAQDSQQEGNFTPFIESGDVDLSADELQSDSTYIAFQYRSSGAGGSTAATWQVDNVALTSSTQPPEDE